MCCSSILLSFVRRRGKTHIRHAFIKLYIVCLADEMDIVLSGWAGSWSLFWFCVVSRRVSMVLSCQLFWRHFVICVAETKQKLPFRFKHANSHRRIGVPLQLLFTVLAALLGCRLRVCVCVLLCLSKSSHLFLSISYERQYFYGSVRLPPATFCSNIFNATINIMNGLS